MKSIGTTIKKAKRLVVFIIGSTVLFIGFAMIVLPGPAVIIIPIGLAILGTEFIWAKRLLNRIKEKTKIMRLMVIQGKADEIVATEFKNDEKRIIR